MDEDRPGRVAVLRELEVELTEASSLGMKKTNKLWLAATWQVGNGVLRSRSEDS